MVWWNYDEKTLAFFLNPSFASGLKGLEAETYRAMTTNITDVRPTGSLHARFGQAEPDVSAMFSRALLQGHDYHEALRITHEHLLSDKVKVIFHHHEFTDVIEREIDHCQRLMRLLKRGMSTVEARATLLEFYNDLQQDNDNDNNNNNDNNWEANMFQLDNKDFGLDAQQHIVIPEGDILSRETYDVDEIERQNHKEKKRFVRSIWKALVLSLCYFSFVASRPAGPSRMAEAQETARSVSAWNDIDVKKGVHTAAHYAVVGVQQAATTLSSTLETLAQEFESLAQQTATRGKEIYDELESAAMRIPASVITPSGIAISDYILHILDPLETLAGEFKAVAQDAATSAMAAYKGLKPAAMPLSASVITPSGIAISDFVSNIMDSLQHRAAVGFQKTMEFLPSQPAPAPSSPSLDTPFETIAVVERWMTPSHFDEDRAVAFFALLQPLLPVEKEQQQDTMRCCHRDDLFCRVKAIVTDFVPEFALHLLLRKNSDGGMAVIDAVDFVLRNDKTLFHPIEIQEPAVHPLVQYITAANAGLASLFRGPTHEPTPSAIHIGSTVVFENNTEQDGISIEPDFSYRCGVGNSSLPQEFSLNDSLTIPFVSLQDGNIINNNNTKIPMATNVCAADDSLWDIASEALQLGKAYTKD